MIKANVINRHPLRVRVHQYEPSDIGNVIFAVKSDGVFTQLAYWALRDYTAIAPQELYLC
tara:strand:- start:1211 stop:1390 length:180 start_codon:yes stop_codon:yes gene_type:complete